MKRKQKPIGKEVACSPLAITTSFFEFQILKNLVEKLAGPGYDPGYEEQLVSAGLETLEIASIEADISGDMVLSNKEDLLHLSFNTCFYFTCIRKQDDGYKLAWSVSLS